MTGGNHTEQGEKLADIIPIRPEPTAAARPPGGRPGRKLTVNMPPIGVPTVAAMAETLKAADQALVLIRRHYEHAEPLIRAAGRGYGSGRSSDGGGRPAGSHSDPTAAAAIQARRDVDERLGELFSDVWGVSALLISLASQIMPLLPKTEDDKPQAAPTPAGAGNCDCCDRWVPGTHKDRLVTGFCAACRKAWERWAAKADDPGNRGGFIRTRRETLDVA